MLILFQSAQFIAFFIVLLAAYWLLPGRARNPLLLLASYIFYASWDWRFLPLLFLITAVNYVCGLKIRSGGSPAGRRLYFAVALIISLAPLLIFKYLDFAASNLAALLSAAGFPVGYAALKLILPLGISFYTFQVLSYTIDIYQGRMEPTKDMLVFALFVAYFPHFLAGPIMRAKDLIPRLQAEKDIRRVEFWEAIYLFGYGAFKKVVIAASMASIVDPIFKLQSPTGAQVLLALYAFSIQLYCDFSGYSDMAIGISLLLGIRLSMNFNLPYFSSGPWEYFKRWHMTLSSWILDYVYTPLFFGLSSSGAFRRVFRGSSGHYMSWLAAAFVTMTTFGLWHGASWHCILNGVYLFAIITLSQALRPLSVSASKSGLLRLLSRIGSRLVTYNLIVFGLLFFRADSVHQAWTFIMSLAAGVDSSQLMNLWYVPEYYLFAALFVYELMQFLSDDQLFLLKRGYYAKLAFVLALLFFYVNTAQMPDQTFIYFQF